MLLKILSFTEKLADAKLMVQAGTEHVYQVGKRKFAKVKIVT
jgi:tyrosyl-tRNA synthetase